VDVTNTGLPSVFIYDKYPGGLGFSRRAFDHMEEILQAGLEMINGCTCEIGCPSCVGSPIPPFSQLDPDSTARGRIPDKEAAKMILHEILGLPAYIPQIPAASEIAMGGVRGGAGAGAGGQSAPPSATPPAAEPLPEHLDKRLRQQLLQLKKRE
jgi:DEAD/DEAH box helicase domain-containing protein